MTAILAGCGGLPPVYLQLGAGDNQVRRDRASMVVADEPQAALVARDILLAGGNAADAAVALGLTLGVTLPSSAGLGGSGACVVHDVVTRQTEALDFMARATANTGGARPHAAVPTLPQGLYALHARYGRVPWPLVVAPAENLARFGQATSRALADDLARNGGILAEDRSALTAFMTPRRQILQAGDAFIQFDLAAALGRLRARGPGGLYVQTLASEPQVVHPDNEGSITAEELRAAVPRWTAATPIDTGKLRVFTLPASAGVDDFAAAYAHADRALQPDQVTAPGASAFVIADTFGNVVACAVTMGRPFGLGIMARSTGFLRAPAPEATGSSAAPLAVVIALGVTNGELVFAIGAAGIVAVNETAQLTRRFAAADDVLTVTTGSDKSTVRRTGLVNYFVCSSRERIATNRCRAQNDPRGNGYALVLDAQE